MSLNFLFAQAVIGVVYAPIKDEMFTARLGKGAYLNGKKLKASKITGMWRREIRKSPPKDQQSLQFYLFNVNG